MKEKGIFGIIAVVLSVGAIVIVLGVVLAIIGSEPQKCVEPNKVVSVESTNANDVSYSIKEFIGYHTADGIFVTTHVVVEEHSKGLTKQKVFKVNNFSLKDIYTFNGKQLPTNWELE